MSPATPPIRLPRKASRPGVVMVEIPVQCSAVEPPDGYARRQDRKVSAPAADRSLPDVTKVGRLDARSPRRAHRFHRHVAVAVWNWWPERPERGPTIDDMPREHNGHLARSPCPARKPNSVLFTGVGHPPVRVLKETPWPRDAPPSPERRSTHPAPRDPGCAPGGATRQPSRASAAG